MGHTTNLVVHFDFLNGRIVPTKDILGKYEKDTLVDNDLSDHFMFLALSFEFYMYSIPTPSNDNN